jgi:hypothetical protein
MNQSGVVVDANFSTLWPSAPDALPSEALLALLNGSWVWANLEATGTVLGGGALKVEATDLRRLPLPDLSAHEVEQLVALGRALVTRCTSDLLQAIDAVVGEALSRGVGVSIRASALMAYAENALSHRSLK